MKFQKYFITLLLSLCSLSLFSQVLYTKSDTIPLTQDSVVLKVGDYRGNVQWQRSYDGENWFDLAGKTKDSTIISNSSEAIYRAKITDGSCDPVFSDSAMVKTTKSVLAHLITPVDSGYTLVSDSLELSAGVYQYLDVSNDKNDFNEGGIIFDEEAGGTIRKITEVVQSDDTIKVVTDQATLEDLFIDTDFKLSTELIPITKSSKKRSLNEISKALTDSDGFIHPYKVKIISDKGIELKSAMDYTEEGDTTIRGGVLYKKWDFSGRDLLYMSGEENLATKMYAPDGSLNTYEYEKEYDLRFYIDEGYFEIDPVFKFEFDFDRPTVDWERFKVNKGELRYFAFYSDESKVDFKTILALDAHYKFKDELEQTLVKDFFTAQFTFVVPPGIPIIILASADLKGKLYNDISAEAHASTGLQSTHYLTFGTKYIKDEGWSIIKGYDNENKYFPITVDGGARWDQRLEIYPQVDFMIYTVFGPSISLIPYINSNVGASLAGNYDAKIDAGFDANAGVKIEVLGKTINEYKTGNKNFLNWTLFQIPYQIEILNGNNQSATVNTYLNEPIEVKVYDKSGKIEGAGVKVYFNPLQGSVNSEAVKTNADGIATCNWQMSNQAGEHKLEVYFKNGDDEIVEDGKIVITATAEAAIVITTPSITTNSATNITETTATLNGNVTSDGGATITQRGFYWSSTDNTPDSDDNPTAVSGTTGSFSKSLTGLTPNTTYYYVAFATNSQGTKTGAVQSFKTNQETQVNTGTFTDSRDGNTYKWVEIGEQIWMAENLAYLPSVNPPSSVSPTEPYFYVYDYYGTSVSEAKSIDNYETYGVMYNWPAAIESCPGGWHLPSDDEWKQLEIYAGMSQNEADGIEFRGTNEDIKLRSTSGWNWLTRPIGTDDFGFSALPGGLYYVDESYLYNNNTEFINIGSCAYWWSSTEFNVNDAYWRVVREDFAGIARGNFRKNDGCSVRCIKD